MNRTDPEDDPFLHVSKLIWDHGWQRNYHASDKTVYEKNIRTSCMTIGTVEMPNMVEIPITVRPRFLAENFIVMNEFAFVK